MKSVILYVECEKFLWLMLFIYVVSILLVFFLTFLSGLRFNFGCVIESFSFQFCLQFEYQKPTVGLN